MFFSRKLEAFMAVVENGSLSKAARVMNRTTPPVAKSIKDFEAVLGKRLFKREKFGMSLTQEGLELYNDLKSLYLQEKEITKKHISGIINNSIHVYYDWGKSQYLTQFYQAANKNYSHINIMRFSRENFEEIPDYDGNTLILSSDKIISEKFSLLHKIENKYLGICCQKTLVNGVNNNLDRLLSENIWLCDPALYKTAKIKKLESEIGDRGKAVCVRIMDDLNCCLNFIQTHNSLLLTDENPFKDEYEADLCFIPLIQPEVRYNCYIYKSKYHSSVLNRFLDLINKME
ncbi:LysR family transcriptional regulator [Proteus faecis]|uniref:LysR family transcriptional regulator n=1 Tax=Proteus faecis TaxID=2050967 RepID=A0AAW7CJQ6_9GAMM|nr:LysR family transcriptional regulator [Proteus faecis]MDL5166873.1 LysR family transcriptional regulator [Proteus faecis]MDL5275021.1 LysR family transcriptional regulator [Proteus faecis]MDL5278590.1 LysR family transcriptional regulator [Proteus faecis]MDL5307592.1 LysR family transcriptional regulator [Proteus faecis]MDL5311151.1 LysR family transcriptional regulator [Proteus faecis]